MSKEYLEAIERIKNKFINFFHEDNPDVECVEDALQRLEQIDNVNPSEALESIEELDNCLIYDMSIGIDDYDESNYCMSYEYIDFNGEALQFNDENKQEKMIDFIREKKISYIKNALLTAQEQNFNYNAIVIPFFNELVKLLGVYDTDEMLDEIKEQEKVLNIIIDREVSIQSFRRKNYKDYEDYCYRSNIYENSTLLTKEEFDLVMRYLV